MRFLLVGACVVVFGVFGMIVGAVGFPFSSRP
jgi:hypothetical protein